MKTLEPIRFRDTYARAYEREVLDYVEDVLLKPLGDGRENSVTTDPLLRAIAKGSISHDGTGWRGSFSIETSKRIRELGGFEVAYVYLPNDIKEALRASQQRFTARKAVVLGILFTVAANVSTVQEPVPVEIAQAVITEACEAAGVTAPEGVAPVLAEELAQARQAVVLSGVGRLRTTLEQATSVVDLEDRIALATTSIRRHAAMVAEQKASETVAATQEAVAQDAGIEEYEWVTMGDSRVRHDHKPLDGRIFRFDSPPVVDTATGRRANPGEDYNCRCFARPIIR